MREAACSSEQGGGPRRGGLVTIEEAARRVGRRRVLVCEHSVPLLLAAVVRVDLDVERPLILVPALLADTRNLHTRRDPGQTSPRPGSPPHWLPCRPRPPPSRTWPLQGGPPHCCQESKKRLLMLQHAARSFQGSVWERGSPVCGAAHLPLPPLSRADSLRGAKLGRTCPMPLKSSRSSSSVAFSGRPEM